MWDLPDADGRDLNPVKKDLFGCNSRHGYWVKVRANIRVGVEARVRARVRASARVRVRVSVGVTFTVRGWVRI